MIPIHPVAAVPPAPTFAASSGLVAPPPLALYVHWPWCVKKCPYCDFNSHESGGAIDAETEAAYLAALVADLEAALPQVWNRPVLSVFIGGGTHQNQHRDVVGTAIGNTRQVGQQFRVVLRVRFRLIG